MKPSINICVHKSEQKTTLVAVVGSCTLYSFLKFSLQCDLCKACDTNNQLISGKRG